LPVLRDWPERPVWKRCQPPSIGRGSVCFEQRDLLRPPIARFVRTANSLHARKKFPDRLSREIVCKWLNSKGKWNGIFAQIAKNRRNSLNLAP
jgi:hypothetical protein